MTYVLLVEFKIREDAIEAVEHAVGANAAKSLTNEPGCERFDVLPPAPHHGEIEQQVRAAQQLVSRCGAARLSVGMNGSRTWASK